MAKSTLLVIMIKIICDSTINPDQEYIYFMGSKTLYTLWGRKRLLYFMGSETIPFTCYTFMGLETLPSTC